MKYSILWLLLLTPFLPLTAQSSNTNVVSGKIIEAKTGEPVPFSYIHLEELNRTAVADADGLFELNNIPNGVYTLTTHRIGYRTQSQRIELQGEDLELEIRLSQSVFSSEAIEVIGSQDGIAGSNLEHASKNIFGADLRRNLGSTLSQTLSNLPGFDQRSNGAAPGRPVIRGLGDERVVILQDGISSGDVSSQSGDHAVSIDPMAANEIEIARGPAALAYGANAIGGVINVVKNQIATTLPSKVNGSFSLNGQSVNTGLSGALSTAIPIGSFALQADLSGRYALDTQTPIGASKNTWYQTTNDALGISYVRPWGYTGASASIFASNYGIPSDPDGHEGGIKIQMRKYQYDSRTEVVLNNNFLKVMELDASFKDYNHQEIEGDNGVIGSEYNLLTTNFDLRFKHSTFGFVDDGSFGLSGEFKDYQVEGANTQPSQRLSAGFYLIEEKDINALHLEAGLRLDWVHSMTSANGIFYEVGVLSGTADSTNYKDRNFTALSGSVAAIYDFGKGFSGGVSVLRSFRAPSLEELYSEGPHLATYSFEIGNPDLQPERAWAKELFMGYQSDRFNLNAAVFHNGFDDYLYARNTGQFNIQRADLLNYQFTSTEARIYGMEFSGEAQLFDHFLMNASFSYTLGDQQVLNPDGTSEERPLPQIPPFKTKMSLKYAKSGFEAGGRLQWAAQQDRTSEFETPTPGYQTLDLFSQYRLEGGKFLHTFSLNINNLMDEKYYNHLSRIKDLTPEPGRNISFLYRLYF